MSQKCIYPQNRRFAHRTPHLPPHFRPKLGTNPQIKARPPHYPLTPRSRSRSRDNCLPRTRSNVPENPATFRLLTLKSESLARLDLHFTKAESEKQEIRRVWCPGELSQSVSVAVFPSLLCSHKSSGFHLQRQKRRDFRSVDAESYRSTRVVVVGCVQRCYFWRGKG